jgi:hypothetical protein
VCLLGRRWRASLIGYGAPAPAHRCAARRPWRQLQRPPGTADPNTIETGVLVPAAVVSDGFDVRRCNASSGARSGTMCCLAGGGGRRSCAAAAWSWRVDAPLKRLSWGGRSIALVFVSPLQHEGDPARPCRAALYLGRCHGYNSRRYALLLMRITEDSNSGGAAMVNSGVPRCIVQAAEGSEEHGRWSRWRKPCRNLCDLDDDDVLALFTSLEALLLPFYPSYTWPGLRSDDECAAKALRPMRREVPTSAHQVYQPCRFQTRYLMS